LFGFRENIHGIRRERERILLRNTMGIDGGEP